uniref:Uncharacterized protein n=1 Tax=Panagrolaimus superbus TaxID=310955 RepID=A0A914Y1P2_9BILA
MTFFGDIRFLAFIYFALLLDVLAAKTLGVPFFALRRHQTSMRHGFGPISQSKTDVFSSQFFTSGVKAAGRGKSVPSYRAGLLNDDEEDEGQSLPEIKEALDYEPTLVTLPPPPSVLAARNELKCFYLIRKFEETHKQKNSNENVPLPCASSVPTYQEFLSSHDSPSIEPTPEYLDPNPYPFHQIEPYPRSRSLNVPVNPQPQKILRFGNVVVYEYEIESEEEQEEEAMEVDEMAEDENVGVVDEEEDY